MPRSTFSGSITAPEVYVTVDMGNPFLNRTVDGFLKIGTVAASRVAAEEAYQCVRKGSISKRKFEVALKRMCKEGVYWGTVTSVYVGVEHNIERISEECNAWWCDNRVPHFSSQQQWNGQDYQGYYHSWGCSYCY